MGMKNLKKYLMKKRKIYRDRNSIEQEPKFRENENCLNVHSLITRCFIGTLTKNGNKLRAERMFSDILTFLRNRTNKQPLLVLEYVLYKISPRFSLYLKKRGGTSYNLPYLMNYDRKISSAIHKLCRKCNDRHEYKFIDRCTSEIFDILRNKPTSLLKEVSQIHNIGLSNRSFFKFR
jgi:small subunit ribosomal protein S7